MRNATHLRRIVSRPNTRYTSYRINICPRIGRRVYLRACFPIEDQASRGTRRRYGSRGALRSCRNPLQLLLRPSLSLFCTLTEESHVNCINSVSAVPFTPLATLNVAAVIQGTLEIPKRLLKIHARSVSIIAAVSLPAIDRERHKRLRVNWITVAVFMHSHQRVRTRVRIITLTLTRSA